MAGLADRVLRTPKEAVAQFPLIDAHSHYVARSGSVNFGFTAEELLRAADAAGIKRMVILGFGPEVANLARQHPDRFVASYVGDTTFGRRQARGEIKDGTLPEEVERVGAEFEDALKSGFYRGIGEIHTYSATIPAQITGGASIPGASISPNSPLIRRLLELADRSSLPINIHCDPPGLGQMVQALGAYPKTSVVWAHAGSFLSPGVIRSILQAFENVSFDLSAKNPACCPGGTSTYPLSSQGVLDASWRQLFEAYPDRFLVGVDFFTSAQLRAARQAGEFYSTILTHLTPATARKIGYENAERLYGLR